MKMLSIQQKETGAALVVGLIMLALMTIIGITAVQSSIVENRIATNMYDKQISFESAEAALRDAEAWLNEQDDHPMPKLDGTGNVWAKDILTKRTDAEDNTYYVSGKDIDWLTHGLEYASLTGAYPIDGVASQPKFVIEEFTFVPDDWSTATIAAGKGLFFYRITAKGYGASENEEGIAIATTALQTMYRKRYN